MSGQQFLEATQAAVDIARRHGASIVVNDRADIARAAGADGVHVGQEDLPATAVRQVVGAASIVGLSTHSPEQLHQALAQPIDYAAIGPVFATATKATGFDARGLDAVRAAAAATAAHRMPLVGIGGITLERAASVIAAGAQSVAVISDLLEGGRPDLRVRAFLEALR
jgi:thiamine-phosphate pyrophosphorylase